VFGCGEVSGQLAAVRYRLLRVRPRRLELPHQPFGRVTARRSGLAALAQIRAQQVHFWAGWV
jgi:hypothetical protein